MYAEKASPFCKIGVCVKMPPKSSVPETSAGNQCPSPLLVVKIKLRIAVRGDLDRAGRNAAGPADGDEGRSQLVAIAALLVDGFHATGQRRVFLILDRLADPIVDRADVGPGLGLALGRVAWRSP